MKLGTNYISKTHHRTDYYKILNVHLLPKLVQMKHLILERMDTITNLKLNHLYSTATSCLGRYVWLSGSVLIFDCCGANYTHNVASNDSDHTLDDETRNITAWLTSFLIKPLADRFTYYKYVIRTRNKII